MPLSLIKPLGNGKFQTPNGVFNSYQEAAMSVGIQPQYGVPHSPAMSNTTPALDALNKAAGTPAMPEVALQSSPMQFKPQQPKQYGGRGEVGMPTKPQNLLDIPQPQQKERSFMDKLFSKEGLGAISNTYLAASQDPALRALGVRGLDAAKELKQSNMTVAMLRKNGENELADLIEKNPSLGKTALTQWLQQKYGTKSGVKTSEVKIDPVTGQQYVVKTDPNTGNVTRENIEGATGLTPQQEADLEMNKNLKEGDIKAGYELGAEYFTKAENVNQQIRQYDLAINALDNNAKSGQLRQFLPAFDQATSELRQAANNLGITVINSATFGALSETELRLALSTGLDLSLPETELRKQAVAKRDAQRKLMNELKKKAREAQNLGRRAFIDKYTQLEDQNPNDIGTEILDKEGSVFDKADKIIGG